MTHPPTALDPLTGIEEVLLDYDPTAPEYLPDDGPGYRDFPPDDYYWCVEAQAELAYHDFLFPDGYH